MGKKSSEKRNRRKYRSSTEKGRVVEQIIASMHDVPGVKVERNVLLSALQSKRKREIDVLVTSNVAGYSVRIAFECKFEEKPVGAPEIDAFVGKLQDIGIPPQQGIFVSASGYTSGAVERAEIAGIRPLVLKGLSTESIADSIGEAFQSVIYLLLEVTNIAVRNNVPNITDPAQACQFYDEQGNPCDNLPDLIWRRWLGGEPPSTIGEHFLELRIPSDWHQLIDGKMEQVIAAAANTRVVGLVVTIPGHCCPN